MASINLIKASDGTGNAAMATVQSTRAPLATTLIVNTVDNIPSTFIGTMGTPHTFVDPITAEEIVVISEATAVDFTGHVDGTNLEIDAIADGYTDLGSAANDVIIIKPTTEWANNLADLLDVAHNDDGTLADDTVEQANLHEKLVDYSFDFVASGCVWSGDAYASTRNASMTAGVVYIGGKRVTVALVTARSFTASKDTYIDVDNTGTLVYTEVTNNAASPALAANSIRIGIIVSGANIAAVGSVNQGQEDKVLPIASSVPYAVTDSLGNLICPRDPNRRVLGHRLVTSNTGTFTAETDLTGLTFVINVPTGRKVKLSSNCHFYSTVDRDRIELRIKESTTTLKASRLDVNNSTGVATYVEHTFTPTAGVHTYKLMGARVIGTGNITMEASGAGEYAWFKAELV